MLQLTPIENPENVVTKIENTVDCPFKIHGCHKRGEKMDVKRHVRDDRNLHLLLLCQSLNPIRTHAIDQQSKYVEKYVELYQSMELAEAVFEKYGSQHIFHIPNAGLAVVRASKSKSNRSIFSQPFFSHGYGYRLMAICAPYGDGIVSRCYNPSEHPEMSEFHQKPIGLRNGAIGFQDFVSLNELHNFTISSDLFLEISVDLKADEIYTAQEIDSSKCQGSQI